MANINNLLDNLDNFQISNHITCLPEDVSSHITHPHNQTKLLCQNICSILGNFDKLLVLLSRIKLDFDFLILTECRLSAIQQNLPALDGYNVHCSTDNFNQNDGVVVYINNALSCTVLEPIFPETNCLVIKISTHTVIVAIYRPYCFKLNVPLFLASLNTVIQSLSSFPNIILVGDINIDISPDSYEKYSEDYLNLLSIHGMLPSHTLPTRQSSCIDHFILKTTKTNKTFVLHPSISDHDAIVLCINIKQPKSVPLTISKIDYVGLEASMSSLDFNPILTLDDPNTAANLLVSLLAQALISNTKLLRLPRRARTIKPWITIGLLRCIRNRDNMHLKLKLSADNSILRVTYRRYRNFCNDILKKVKREYQRQEILAAGSNSRKLWDVIKRNINMNKPKDYSSNLLTMSDSPSRSVNDVNEYFVNIGKSLAEKILLHNNSTVNTNPFTYGVTKSFGLLDTDEAEIESIITSLKNNCAKGWDGIPSSILKQYKNILIPPITHVCRLSLSAGVFPDAFKKAVIKPIYKAGDRSLISNYRPISLLPSLSKVLERIMNKRLMNYLEVNNLLSPHQYGFRAERSTASAVHGLTEFIVGGLDEGRKCLSVFLDLAKAFDTVSIPLLLQKLEHLGIRGLSLNLFRSYLTNRSQLVKIDNHISNDLPVLYGIPQGSILGPSLFLVFINDLCNMQLNNGKIVSFADDTALIFEAPTLEELFINAQNGLNSILRWLGHNLLTINADKTKYMLFSIRNTLSQHHNLNLTAHTCNFDPILCTCPVLENVSTIKYLGINLDQNLNFKTHINLLSTRTRKLVYIFKNLRHIADQKILKVTYYALCQSILTYCITIWGGAHKTTLKKLEVAQRTILKVSTFRPYLFSTSKLYEECKVLSVRQLFIASTVLRKHSLLTYDPNFSQNQRRHDLVCTGKIFKTSFAKRFFVFLGSYLYNKCNGVNKIYALNRYNCKNKVTDWLLNLNYEDTEDLFDVIA